MSFPTRLIVKSAIKAGGKPIIVLNHAAARLVVKTATKAGTHGHNHSAVRIAR